jgi:outer membrane protein assembly factor BamB
MPSRRQFLLSAALVGVAGCTGGEPPSDSTATESTVPGTTATTTTRGTTETTTDGTTTSYEPRREPPKSGAVRWRVAFDAPVTHPPAVGDDGAYVAVGQAEISQSREPESSGALAALEAKDGTPRWTTELPAAPASQPEVYDGGIYCTSGGSTGFSGIDHRLHRFDSDGAEQWRTDGVDQFLNRLAFGESRAYLATSDDALGFDGQRLFAVGLADGETQWSVESGDAFDGRLLDGTLLVASGGGRAIENRDAETGERRWQRRLEPLRSGSGSFAILDDLLFVEGRDDEDGWFGAVEVADGSERWSYARDGGQSFVPTGAAVTDDGVVGTEYDGRVFSLAPADGTEQWTFDADGETRRSPVVAEGRVYVRAYRNEDSDVIHALDSTTGEQRWRVTVPGVASSLRNAGEVLVVRADKGRAVYGLDPADGSVRWSFEAPSRLSRLAVADDRVYVTSERGVVRKLGE